MMKKKSFKKKKNGKIKIITKDEIKEEGKVKFKDYKAYITHSGGFIMTFIFIDFYFYQIHLKELLIFG